MKSDAACSHVRMNAVRVVTHAHAVLRHLVEIQLGPHRLTFRMVNPNLCSTISVCRPPLYRMQCGWNDCVSESAVGCYGSVSNGCAGNAESTHFQPSRRLDAACHLRLALIHSLASIQLRFIAALYSSKVISASSSASKVGYKMPFKWSNSC